MLQTETFPNGASPPENHHKGDTFVVVFGRAVT